MTPLTEAADAAALVRSWEESLIERVRLAYLAGYSLREIGKATKIPLARIHRMVGDPNYGTMSPEQ